MKTLIISPTYNEIKNAPFLVEKIFDINPEFHLLIVDDNSPDGTAEAIKKLTLSNIQTLYSLLFYFRIPNIRQILNLQTIQTASNMIDLFIFENPTVRSINIIGCSTILYFLIHVL